MSPTTLLATIFVCLHKASSLDLKNQGLSSVSDADIPTNVTRLDLYRNPIICILRSDFNNKFPELTYLAMVRNTISHIDTGCFSGTQLQRIYLGSNQLTKFPDFYQVKDTLLEVGLSGNPLTSVSFDEVNYLENLKRLSLSNTMLTHITEDLQRLGLILKGSTLVCCQNLLWVKTMGGKAQTDDNTVCSSATSLSGREWNSITTTELQNETCPNFVSETREFGILTLRKCIS
jgi:Leucine-rich repeat (LRR) protein